ncbi:MAG: hypothetical protein ACXVXP_00205 [Mycobacteriaceae bacterium]
MSETWICDPNGDALVTRHADGSVTWDRADENIHIAAELADKADEYPLLWEVYAVGDWCPKFAAYHGRRTTNPHNPPALGQREDG